LDLLKTYGLGAFGALAVIVVTLFAIAYDSEILTEVRGSVYLGGLIKSWVALFVIVSTAWRMLKGNPRTIASASCILAFFLTWGVMLFRGSEAENIYDHTLAFILLSIVGAAALFPLLVVFTPWRGGGSSDGL
jgi:hypothetical protein